MLNQLEEVTVSEQGIRPQLRLKDGTEVDAGAAHVRLMLLQTVQERRPEHFRALLAIARGEEKESGQNELVKYYPWFKPDGTLEPLTRSLLVSSYRETPDGPMLVNPFRLTTQGEVEGLERVEEDVAFRLRSLFGSDTGRGI